MLGNETLWFHTHIHIDIDKDVHIFFLPACPHESLATPCSFCDDEHETSAVSSLPKKQPRIQSANCLDTCLKSGVKKKNKTTKKITGDKTHQGRHHANYEHTCLSEIRMRGCRALLTKDHLTPKTFSGLLACANKAQMATCSILLVSNVEEMLSCHRFEPKKKHFFFFFFPSIHSASSMMGSMGTKGVDSKSATT